jgi:hypothetical protein
VEKLQNLGRMLVLALLVLTVVLPTAAVAGERDDAPLSDVPSEYVPALRAAAEGLGLSYDELTSASEDELQALLCDKLDQTSTDEIVAQARAALDEAPEEELAQLSDAEREQLMEDLPAIIGQVESRYCDDDAGTSGDDTSGDDVDDTDDTDAGTSDDDASLDGDIPVPTRVDTGGGGAGGAGTVPVAFGALFAALFGLVGVGVTNRRSTG